jgi:DNA-binding transcriptional MocR family regulator
MNGKTVIGPSFLKVTPPAVTRQMAGALDRLKQRGKQVNHLGAGYPSPRVASDYLEGQNHFLRYLKHVADTHKVPVEQIMRSMRGYADTTGITIKGRPIPRENFAKVYGGDFDTGIDTAHVIPTTGSTGAIDLLCTVFASPGEKIAYLSDNPTYAGFITRAQRDNNATIYSVPMDAEGPIAEDIRSQIRAARADGHHVAFYYTMADGHNPGGIAITQSRREEIYKVAQEEDIIIVEDGPYPYISFEDASSRPKPFFAQDPDKRVIHLFTASKIWEPGKRVAYMIVPTTLKAPDGREMGINELVTTTIASTNLMPDHESLLQFDAFLHTETGNGFALRSLWEEAEFRAGIYQQNRDVLLAGLEHYLGEYPEIFKWTKPGSGFFSVLTLLGGHHRTDGQFVSGLIEADEVTTIPMFGFYTGIETMPLRLRDTGHLLGYNELRLAFSYTEEDDDEGRLSAMQTATEKLGRAMRRLHGLPMK